MKKVSEKEEEILYLGSGDELYTVSFYALFDNLHENTLNTLGNVKSQRKIT